MEIDMTIFVVESIVSNKKLYRNIDRIYKKFKYETYKLAKESEFYNHPIFTIGDIDTEIYSKRVLGILLYAKENEACFKDLYELLKTGWNQIISYVEKTDTVKFNELIEIVSNIVKGKSNNFSDDEINAFITITLVAAQVNEKEIDLSDDLYSTYCNMINLRINYYANQGNLRKFGYKNLTSDLKKKAISLKKRIISKYGLPKDVRDLYYKWENEKSFLDIWNLLFESEGIEFNFEHDLDNRMVEELCALSFLHNNNLNVEEAIKIFIPGVYMKVLLKEYKKIKDYYFSNHKETLYFDMKNKDNKIKEKDLKISLFEKEVKMLKDRIDALNNKDEKLEKENILLESENNKLKEKINKLEEERTELYELREHIFNKEVLSTDNEIQHEHDIDYESIEKINAVFVGGTPKWQEQLKKIFHNSHFISGDKLNFDDRVLINIDYVFFNVIGMSHAMYYKVRSICRRKGIKYYFVNNYDKTKTIEQIIDILTINNN